MAKPRTFANQDKLPRLPIPSLEETAQKYLQTLRPVLSPAEYEKSAALVSEFIKPNGLGPVLQSRLIAHDKAQPNSWLEEWWLTKIYLEWREALMINSNWWILFKDHPMQPKELFEINHGRMGKGEFTAFQLKRAAGLISNALNYKEFIESESVPPETTKAGPLCMNQFRYLFGVTRIPEMNRDRLVHQFPCTSKHIAVLVKDQVYKVPVYDNEGGRVTVGDVERQLHLVVQDALSSSKEAPVCILTGEHRDNWAKARKELIKYPVNVDSLRIIEGALFAVALDDYAASVNYDESHRLIAHGMDGHNRWFDKALTIVVTANGRAGCNGEHSPQDALIPAYLFEYVIGHEPAQDPPNVPLTTPQIEPPTKLCFKIDGEVQKFLEKAEVNLKKAIADSDISICEFTAYGADFMKRAGFSPDAYMQMAIQLSYYRLHKKFTPTYETAATRFFKHGRTETCRTLSVDSKKWCEAMDDEKVSLHHKFQALQAAAKSHIKYISTASMGKGVDRHLFGLRMCLKPGEKCPIFEDPAYWKSQEWLLSTSGLGANSHKVFYGTGFGCVYPNGYGINYFAGPSVIRFGIESKHSSIETDTSLFRLSLLATLRDMKKLVESVGKGGGGSTTGDEKMNKGFGDGTAYPSRRVSKL
ncbi:acyltransferase ChoActase/COT/CPT [Paraphysoderma sedebokerense]|nr:acyltransferase ChoActase/COT/CPT [Paraphysoderma sedebokerense]